MSKLKFKEYGELIEQALRENAVIAYQFCPVCKDRLWMDWVVAERVRLHHGSTMTDFNVLLILTSKGVISAQVIQWLSGLHMLVKSPKADALAVQLAQAILSDLSVDEPSRIEDRHD